ncbi:MAG: hypothetical protein HY000_22345 [Planctomycetes bacterium]|nr:hypothetical protein [Planctomycetota bacterium]
MNTLRGYRNRADYELTAALSQPTAVGQVQIAEQILQALDAAALQPTRTHITDAMKTYERDVLKQVTWQP